MPNRIPIATGLNITPVFDPLGWSVGTDCFAPQPERRSLDAIRQSLADPHCTGPDIVYAICMDVGMRPHHPDLIARHLLFGVVAYAAGRLGDEPIRSQGHVHKPSPRNGWSTPEVYEIWTGAACILMQESDASDPGRCFAVHASPGQVVVVPPGWAHATLSTDPQTPLSFGAWCDRAYGFDYAGVREHGGLAWFPHLSAEHRLSFNRNPRYDRRPLVEKSPGSYADLGITPGVPIYTQYEQSPGRFDFVPDPARAADLWRQFIP
jgi:glucose-6-phosphate isomerase, archaeal